MKNLKSRVSLLKEKFKKSFLGEMISNVKDKCIWALADTPKIDNPPIEKEEIDIDNLKIQHEWLNSTVEHLRNVIENLKTKESLSNIESEKDAITKEFVDILRQMNQVTEKASKIEWKLKTFQTLNKESESEFILATWWEEMVMDSEINTEWKSKEKNDLNLSGEFENNNPVSEKYQHWWSIFKTLMEAGEKRENITKKEINWNPISEDISKDKTRKSIFGWLAEFWFKTTETKNKISSYILKKATDLSKWNTSIRSYFSKYSEIHKKEQTELQKNKKNVEKDSKIKLSWISQWFLNIFKYWRIIYDAIDTVSFKTINPFRNITAASMFIWKSLEVAKETRLDNDEVKQKTRLDEENASIEGWRLYQEIVKKNGWKLNWDALEIAYKRRLCEDLKIRFEKNDLKNAWFFKGFLERDTKKYIESLERKINKIREDRQLSLTQKQEKIDFLLKKNDKLLLDLDRMISSDWQVDGIAYWTRLVEKVSKWIANALVIDSVWRLTISANEHFNFFKVDNSILSKESLFVNNPETSGNISSEKRDPFLFISEQNKKTNDEIISIESLNKINNDSEYSENLNIYELNNSLLNDEYRYWYSVDKYIYLNNLKPKFRDVKIMKPSLVKIEKGDSVWRVLHKILWSTDKSKLNNAIWTVVKTIEKNPWKYWLNVSDINVVTIENLENVDWWKAIKKSFSRY